MTSPSPASPLLGRGPRPMYLALRDHLRDTVATLTPGDQLPSEKALCETHGVSRITARQALDLLVQEGLIRRVAGKGSFVATRQMPFVLRGIQGLGQLISRSGVREPLFSAVRAVEERPSPEHVAEQLEIPAGTPVVYIERLRSIAAGPLSVDRSYLPLDPGRELARLDLEREDVFVLLEERLGRPIERIDADIEARQAETGITRDLDLVPGAPLLVVTRTAHSTGPRPLMAEIVCFRGDRFRYAVTVVRDRDGTLR